LPADATTSSGSIHIKVLGFNDFHGQLSPKVEHGRSVGGAAVLTAYLRAASAGIEDRTIIVHAGDLVGASPANSALLQDEPAVSFMNLLANAACQLPAENAGKCNVVGTVGNHELDEGLAELRRLLEGGQHSAGPYLEQPWRGARFPFVSANIVDIHTRKPVFEPYVVIDVAGMKLAFIGAILRSTPSMVTASGIAGLEFDDEADSVNRVIPELHARGVHAIVLLIHQGLTQSNYEGPTREDAPPATGALLDIIRRLDDDVDVIVSGHTHQFTNAYLRNAHGASMLVVQAWSAGTAFDDIDLWIDPKSRDVVAKRASVVTSWDDRGPGRSPDVAAAALVSRADKMVAARVDEVLAQSLVPIERRTNDAGESPLGDLVADAHRLATGADFAVTNPGGVRSDLPSGVMTWGDAFAVQPFGNELVILTVTGQELVDLLREQWSSSQPPSGRILAISGFSYVRSPASSRGGVQILEVLDGRGKPIVPTATYKLATNQFLAEGGDGFSLLKRAKREAAGRLDRDALIDYLRKSPRPLELPAARRIKVDRSR
jgi:5'-nucleotidase